MRLLSFLVGSTAVLSVAAEMLPIHHPIPYEVKNKIRQASPAASGVTYNIQNYTNGNSDYDFEDGDDGNWSVTWRSSPGTDFVVGKGYQPNGGTFNYSGTFQPASGANSYLALYGWGSNPNGDVPVVEWYIIESMGIHNPSDNRSATQYGVMQSDGATYEIWMKPNYDGTDDMPFHQYWSIRKPHVFFMKAPAFSLTVPTSRHIDARWRHNHLRQPFCGLECGRSRIFRCLDLCPVRRGPVGHR
jgi:endo-1,4-beta-xylanase